MNGWVFEGHTLDIPKCVKLLPDNWALIHPQGVFLDLWSLH